MAHLEEKTISSEQKFDGRIVKLYVDKAELEDGKLVTGRFTATRVEYACFR